jgi:putative transposase
MVRRYRLSPRLKDFDYIGPLAAHVTIVTRLRKPIFVSSELANLCIELFHQMCRQFSAETHAYCFMPDHVHLLVSIPPGAYLTDFIRQFKQVSGYLLKKRLGYAAWQISYYDHVLRNEESMIDVARYIWDNPVKEGLVEDAVDYPFSGPKELLAQT